MAKKRKKESLTWRITKKTFGLTGRGIANSFKFFNRKIKEGKERRKLEKSFVYNAKAGFSELIVNKKINGNYDEFENRLLEKSLIVLIFGKRGSGKSALGFRIVENIHFKTGRKCFILDVNQELLPRWIKSIENVDQAEDNSIVLVDEGAISFGARDSMSSKNKELTKIMAVARHNDLTLIFITQNTGLIDRNVLKLADIMLIKEGSLLQLEMERNEIKKFYAKSKKYFDEVKDKIKYVYVIDDDFEGLVEYSLPSFWSEKISKNRG